MRGIGLVNGGHGFDMERKNSKGKASGGPGHSRSKGGQFLRYSGVRSPG